jgi:hypothetical protein
MNCTTNECPTSLITVESIKLFDDFLRARTAHRAFGAISHGADSDEWPALWGDAVAVLSHAENEADRLESGY